MIKNSANCCKSTNNPEQQPQVGYNHSGQIKIQINAEFQGKRGWGTVLNVRGEWAELGQAGNGEMEMRGL